METKQLNGYRIQFVTKELWCRESNIFGMSMQGAFSCKRNQEEITKQPYGGLVSEISEELAEKIVEGRYKNGLYPDYTVEEPDECMIYRIQTAKESFQTLSDLEYCVITKLDDKEG